MTGLQSNGVVEEARVYDLVIRGGRVMDPESGTDEVLNVGINGQTILEITSAPLRSQRVVDADGLVVAPGWIDLHSHAQTVAGSRMQVHDGVTTALDLEGGLSDVAGHYDAAAKEGRAVNYGFSASWQQARMREVGGLSNGRLTDVLGHFGNPAWKQSATPRQLDALFAQLGQDVSDGAIGVGMLIGYAPRVEPSEYLRAAGLVAESGTAMFTHARDLIEDVPDAVIDGAEEIVEAAQATGARSHYCHINSTSLWHIDRVHDLIARSQTTISTEAYPYGAAATAISADFLAPERLHEHRLSPDLLVYTPSGQPIRGVRELAELRRNDPGAVVIVHYLDEDDPVDRGVLQRALSFPGAVVGSDAMPLEWSETVTDPFAWPPPPELVVHPRGAGTFSRFFRRYVRELGSATLMDAIERCSLGPARILQDFVPQMQVKGRLQVGCDADIVVFDPATVTDMATYQQGAQASRGYAYVIVGGQVTIDHDRLEMDVLAGRPVRSRANR